MTARLRKLLTDLGDNFWLVPALLVLAGILLAMLALWVDDSRLIPPWMLAGWLYNGGGTGARTLLGAIASSSIGVAGTVFSITIAALSLAAGQMGPRLLRNFVRDRGNQITLGALLGTFSYALMVLRSVRTQDEGAFTPHLALSFAILLALLCVGTLVYFVGHMAGRINVDTVVQLVSDDVHSAILRLTSDTAPIDMPPADWSRATEIRDSRRGYLQELDESGLASWASEQNTTVRLLVRPGDYIFPGAPIALVVPEVEGVGGAIRDATAIGQTRVSSADLEFAVRQLVEVAVRALSPGINDPHTAISVIDRLGTALCDVAPRHLPNGVVLRNDRPVLFVPSVDYDGLTDAMLHMIRQNATTSPAVLIRMLDVLTMVAACEGDPGRRASLDRHADLVLADAERAVPNAADRADIVRRHANYQLVRRQGVAAIVRNRDREE